MIMTLPVNTPAMGQIIITQATPPPPIIIIIIIVMEELQHDLNESQIIEIEGAQIEVIEANPRSITYRVIANFPSRQ